MGAKTGIEWCDSTWNPIEGCWPVSPGCANCYAKTTAARFGGPGQHYDGLVRIGEAGKPIDQWSGAVRFVEKHLLDPLRWKSIVEHSGACELAWETLKVIQRKRPKCGCPRRPRRIFVNSMSDLFYEKVERRWQVEIFAVMAATPWHRFQVLTKRPEEMARIIADSAFACEVLAEAATLIGSNWPRYTSMPAGFAWNSAGVVQWFDAQWPLPNVWLGVSVENQATADERIPLLLKTPAAVRFISAEPLLGVVSLDSSMGGTKWIGGQRGCAGMHSGNGSDCAIERHHHHDDRCGRGLDWVIAGCESGSDARDVADDAFRSLCDQCTAARVPFFLKQMMVAGKLVHGPVLDGQEYKNFPEAAA